MVDVINISQRVKEETYECTVKKIGNVEMGKDKTNELDGQTSQ